MRDPYEVLGVAHDATAEQIKRAYRKASSAAHPDREGGSTERMAGVNAAHDILSDELKRAAFDSGEAPLAPIEQEARDTLVSLFEATVRSSDGDWLAEVRKMLDDVKNGILEQRHRSQVLQARLTQRSGRIKVAAGPNLLQSLIDKHLEQLAKHIKSTDRGLEVNRLARLMLDNYTDGSALIIRPTLTGGFQWRIG